MLAVTAALIAYCRALLLSRHDAALEIAALRQQLAVFSRKQRRPKLRNVDRVFWALLKRIWGNWPAALIIVKPETVVSWHRAGFRLFWRWRSKARQPGRPKISPELRDLIRQMKLENPTWGAPRIHGELLRLGFDVSEPSVSRYLQRLNPVPCGDRAKQWLTFLNNHREVIAAMDFCTVPTLAFRTLYCFFVIEHERRKILHFNVTAHPTSEWIVQQLREALPLPTAIRYVVLDGDAKFGRELHEFFKASGIQPIHTAVRSPWQNGAAERWVGSIRREMLDHVIPIGEQHIKRLCREYAAYYHEDRTHLGLEKNTPAFRTTETRSRSSDRVVATSKLGGLHHRYSWCRAA